MRRSGVIRDYSGLIVSLGIALGCPSRFKSVAANRLKCRDRGSHWGGGGGGMDTHTHMVQQRKVSSVWRQGDLPLSTVTNPIYFL